MNSKAYWVGFNLIKGIGAVRLQSLINFFGSLEVAWGAPQDALKHAGLSQKLADAVCESRRQIDPAERLEAFEKAGIQIFTWEDAAYPRLLKEIDQPPPVLYVRGEITPDDEWAVAVVGTRRITAYGKQVSAEIGRLLGENGVTLVSGMARGVDAAAHEAVLSAGGRTFAVLGCGVDVIYPPEHRRLAENIIEHGALISDYPPGTQPESANFPPRNRIISGLSLATVVVEAGQTSGALITAAFAVEQGRDVLAVPGYIYAPQSKGSNALILQGARPLLGVRDILEVLDLQHISEHKEMRTILPENEIEVKLLNVITTAPQHLDDISALAGLPVNEAGAALAMMELKGMVRHLGNMTFVVY